MWQFRSVSLLICHNIFAIVSNFVILCYRTIIKIRHLIDFSLSFYLLHFIQDKKNVTKLLLCTLCGFTGLHFPNVYTHSGTSSVAWRKVPEWVYAFYKCKPVVLWSRNFPRLFHSWLEPANLLTFTTGLMGCLQMPCRLTLSYRNQVWITDFRTQFLCENVSFFGFCRCLAWRAGGGWGYL